MSSSSSTMRMRLRSGMLQVCRLAEARRRHRSVLRHAVFDQQARLAADEVVARWIAREMRGCRGQAHAPVRANAGRRVERVALDVHETRLRAVASHTSAKRRAVAIPQD